MVASVVIHHVKGADTVLVALIDIGIIVRQTQHMPRLMNEGLGAVGRVIVQGNIVRERHAVQHKGRVVAAIVRLVAPPGAAPARIRPGKVDIYPVHKPVTVAVKLAKIHAIRIQRSHGLLKEERHVTGVKIPVMDGGIACHLPRDLNPSIGGTRVIGRKALVGVAGLILARRTKGNLPKRVLGVTAVKAVVRKIDPDQQYFGLTGGGHARFPVRGNSAQIVRAPFPGRSLGNEPRIGLVKPQIFIKGLALRKRAVGLVSLQRFSVRYTGSSGCALCVRPRHKK